MKKLTGVCLVVVFLSACGPQTQAPINAGEVPVKYEPATTEVSQPQPTQTTRLTLPPTSTATATPDPSPTLTPTITPTFTPSATKLGGGNGYWMMFANLQVLRISVDGSEDLRVVLAYRGILNQLGIQEMSTLWTDSLSPEGDIVALWNCDAKICDNYRGTMYLFTTDYLHKKSIDLDGYPYFIDWSSDQDRLLIYLNSTMADEYYLVKTTSSDFGELVSLGRMNDVTWAHDGQSLFAQKGGTVYHLDKDGNELEKFTCMFNDDCIHAPSPDGLRFAGIQKHVPTGQGNPVITISNKDFTEKKSLFISNNHTLIISVDWLADDRHIVVTGVTSKQRNRRMWRHDYLSIIDADTGEEVVVELEVPEDSEYFAPCGLSPDRKNMVYLGMGGRVKSEGRLLWSGRYAQIIPLLPEIGELVRVTDIENAWESCPVWLGGK